MNIEIETLAASDFRSSSIILIFSVFEKLELSTSGQKGLNYAKHFESSYRWN